MYIHRAFLFSFSDVFLFNIPSQLVFFCSFFGVLFYYQCLLLKKGKKRKKIPGKRRTNIIAQSKLSSCWHGFFLFCVKKKLHPFFPFFSSSSSTSIPSQKFVHILLCIFINILFHCLAGDGGAIVFYSCHTTLYIFNLVNQIEHFIMDSAGF